MLFTCSPLKYVRAGKENSVNYSIHKNRTVIPKCMSRSCGSTMNYNSLDTTIDGKIQSFILVDINEMSDKVGGKC